MHHLRRGLIGERCRTGRTISVEWFHGVDTDSMGLSFSEWIPDEDEDDAEMPSVLNSTELRAVEGQPIDLTSTDSLTLSVVPTKQIEPALLPPPPPLSKKSSRVAARVAAQSGPKATPGARVSKGGGGAWVCRGGSAIAAAGCRGRGACGSGRGRTGQCVRARAAVRGGGRYPKGAVREASGGGRFCCCVSCL